MKTTLSLITLIVSTAALAQSGTSENKSDAIITIQPARDLSYNESFASRRKPVAMRDDPGMLNVDKGRAAVGDFAKCLYDSDKTGASRVLSAPPGMALRKEVTSFANGQCWLRGFLTFRPSALQGALFVTAYRAQYSKLQPPLADAPIDYSATASAAGPALSGLYVALRRFGECVVRTNQETAHALVLADVNTSAESQAFSALMPALSACLDKGQSVVLTKEVAKSTLAEVLYRHASKTMSAGSGR